MPTNGMTIDSLNTVSSMTAQDEVPVWDKEASGEPTRKITAQNMTNSVKTLGSLVNTTEMNNAIAQSTADVIRTGDVVNSLTSTETQKPLSAAQGKAINDKIGGLTIGFGDVYVETNYRGANGTNTVEITRLVNGRLGFLITTAGIFTFKTSNDGTTIEAITSGLVISKNGNEYSFDCAGSWYTMNIFVFTWNIK